MRFATVETIYEAALKDPRIVFITGDLGHAKTEEFRSNTKGRYYNAGMAEQNIVGMAAGLALSGMKVFVYSIVPFITLRCFEQIKIDVCVQNVDVTIVGVGAGFAYGSAGATHYSIEDVAALRALPNMKIVSPANPTEAMMLTQEVIAFGGPAYIRIGRGKERDYPIPYNPKLGVAGILKKGEDVSIITSGVIASEALKAAEILEQNGVSTEVVNMHTIKPIDRDLVLDRAKNREAIFTLEEHNIFGGLGAAVAELISEATERPRTFRRFGVEDAWPEFVGSPSYMLDELGISGARIAEKIKKLVG